MPRFKRNLGVGSEHVQCMHESMKQREGMLEKELKEKDLKISALEIANGKQVHIIREQAQVTCELQDQIQCKDSDFKVERPCKQAICRITRVAPYLIYANLVYFLTVSCTITRCIYLINVTICCNRTLYFVMHLYQYPV